MNDDGVKDRRTEEREPEEGEEVIEYTHSKIHVYNRDKYVCVTFDPAPEFLHLPAGEALRLGRELVNRAKRAMRNQSGRVPRA